MYYRCVDFNLRLFYDCTVGTLQAALFGELFLIWGYFSLLNFSKNFSKVPQIS
jgi:hypothetical protein